MWINRQPYLDKGLQTIFCVFCRDICWVIDSKHEPIDIEKRRACNILNRPWATQYESDAGIFWAILQGTQQAIPVEHWRYDLILHKDSKHSIDNINLFFIVDNKGSELQMAGDEEWVDSSAVYIEVGIDQSY